MENGWTRIEIGHDDRVPDGQGSCRRYVPPHTHTRARRARAQTIAKKTLLLGQKAAAQAAALAAQVQAAHNQAIIQELDTFTRLEPHSHRWDVSTDHLSLPSFIPFRGFCANVENLKQEEDEEDDMIDFPDVPHISPPPPPPPQLPSTDDQPQQQPVSKSDRFAEDFDRSWPPRRSGGGDDGRSKDNTNEKVLFNASSNRLESRPEQSTRLDTARSSDRERPWGPKLLGRETGDVASASASVSASVSGLGGKRSLPPHLSITDTPAPPAAAAAGEGPSAASGSWRSSVPARPAWGGSRPTPSSGAGAAGGGGMGEQRQSWESRNDERERERERAVGSGVSGQQPGRRSFNAGQPPPRSLYTHPQPHTLPLPHATSAAAAAPLPPASSTTSTDPDPQSLEMHTAAEKARLRRLEEEKEREAAKERARMKAKALEEKLKAAAQPESQYGKREPSSIPQQQQQQQQLTIAQRPPVRDGGGGVPPRTTSSEMDKPSRAESEPSWRARAQPPPPPPPPPAPASSQEAPQLPSSSSSFVRGERKEEEKEEKVMSPLYDSTGLGASSSPSPESAQQPISSSSAAPATATAQQQPALSSSSFDGMLARVKAAMLEMQQTREKEVREKELEKEREKEAVKQVQVEEKMPAKEEVEKRHVLKASRAEQVKEEKAKPMTTTTTTTTTPKATTTPNTSRTPNQTSQPPSSKPPTVSAPAAEYEPPQFFDITYPQPPRSPPPAWRTYNIRLPKSSSLPRPRCFDLPAISSSQQTKWEKAVEAPKGWARTFEPPLENEETIEDVLDRAKMLLPQSRVVTKVGEIVVSISPRVLERVKERVVGVDGEVKEGREKRRVEKVGGSVVEEEEGEEEVRTGVEKAAVLLESSTKPVQAPAPVPPTTTSSTTQQQQQPPPRRKSPVKSAAQAEKDPSTFILQGVGLAIAPPPHISLSSLPASSVSGSTSRDGKDGSFSLLSEDGKPGVRFMVSSELEGDSLLEEVNKMSLESVEEAKGEKNDDKEEVCRTHPLLICKMLVMLI